MSSVASILHADLDSFYASVEQRDEPSLRGRPVAVGGGVILAASYEAKAHGVRSAMGARQARRLCPDLIIVPARFSAYTQASRAVFEIFRGSAPEVEGLSIDEAFLDVRGLERISGTPPDIAARLRERVRLEVGLPITVGVARTKFLAKVASGVAKPDGLLVVAPDEETAFLPPLSVDRLWGVGPKTAASLAACGVITVGDVTRLGEAGLVALLGPSRGRHLLALAEHRDPRRVTPGRRRRSIGAQRALGPGPHPFDAVAASLIGLVDRVGGRLRRADRRCRTVVLRLRWGDYERATRSRTLTEPTAQTATIQRAALELLDGQRGAIAERGLTLVGVALTNLDVAAGVQLSLPFDPSTELDGALDAVRDRFGAGVLTRGSLVGPGRGLGESVPLLEDR